MSVYLNIECSGDDAHPTAAGEDGHFLVQKQKQNNIITNFKNMLLFVSLKNKKYGH